MIFENLTVTGDLTVSAGTMTVNDDGSGLFRIARAGGDTFAAFSGGAGVGTGMQSTNSAISDYEPLQFFAESFTFNYRTGVLTSAAGLTISSAGNITVNAGSLTITAGSLLAHNGTAIPAGGTAGAGLRLSSTANFGVFFGSGAPTLSAAQGSLYLRSDGSSTSTRAYINTDGGTTWTAITTAA